MSGRDGISRGRQYTGIGVLALLVALALALPAAASACGEEGPEDTGPLVRNAKVAPASLSYEGGTAAVSAEVEDDCGIQQVYAEIYSTEGEFFAVQMLPYEVISGNSIVYRAEFNVPTNFHEWEVGYQANVSAEDTNGAYAEAYAGEVDVAAAPQFDEAPYVSGAFVSPSVVGSAGGQVRIGVDASDNRGIANAFAIVTLPNGTQEEVWLEPTSSSHFESIFKVPANNGTTRQEYSVVAYAEDDIGQQTSESAGSFAVAPASGLLNAWTSDGSYFHQVAIGDTATRYVVVRNSGGPKTAPVKAAIKISGAGAYSLQGATDGKIYFKLQPGARRVFAVDFSPTAVGYKVATVTVTRKDGAQDPISVTLTGQAVRPAD
jgi:hypothetical protein